MNSLRVNPETGYIDSPNSEFAFNSERKIEFLKVAADFVDNHKVWPDLGDVCRLVGISVRTFQNHLAMDEKFAGDWRELELKGEATCLADAYALRKKNPMYMFGWLRAKFPEKYDPNKKTQITVDVSGIKKELDDGLKIIETEIVPNPPKISSPEHGG